MRKTMFASLIALIFGIGCLAYAQPKSNKNTAGANTAGVGAAGAWSGAWTGGSSGQLEMAITKGVKGKLSATLTANPNQGDGFTVQAKSVIASGSKLTLKFESPGGGTEGTLRGVIKGSSINGNYSIRSKANGEVVDKGTFTATRK